jgi:hypothetical protein
MSLPRVGKEEWLSRCLLVQSWSHLEATTSSSYGVQLTGLVASYALSGLVVRSGNQTEAVVVHTSLLEFSYN